RPQQVEPWDEDLVGGAGGRGRVHGGLPVTEPRRCRDGGAPTLSWRASPRAGGRGGVPVRSGGVTRGRLSGWRLRKQQEKSWRSGFSDYGEATRLERRERSPPRGPGSVQVLDRQGDDPPEPFDPLGAAG